MDRIDPTIWYSLALILIVVAVLALLLLGWVIWTVRKIDLPADADFFTTLRATPFSVVLLLDLLDFAFDFLSAPIAWIVLSRLGLIALRGVSVVESVIPGTQFLPTMTAAWIVARFVRTK